MNFVNIKYLNLLLSFFNFNFSFFQGYIFCKILCLWGGNGAGKKMKIEKKGKKREKGERKRKNEGKKKRENDNFLHTLL